MTSATETASQPRGPRRHFARRRINPFIVIVLLVMGLVYAYIGSQLIPPLELPWPAAISVWALLLSPFGMILWLPFVYWQLDEPTPAHERWLWAAFGSMALLSFLLFFVALRDLLLLGAGLLGFVGGALHGPGPIAAFAGAAAGWAGGTSRVPLALTDARGTGLILALTAASLALGFLGARRTPRVLEVEVPIAGLPEALRGLKIAQISDLHISPGIRRPFVEKVVARVNGLKPDLVALTGDLVDGTVKNLAPHFDALRALEAPLGRFYVTGNHEYYWGHEEWIEHVRACGLTALTNSHAVVERGGAKLVVAGVLDYWAKRNGGKVDSDPAAAIRGAPGDAAARILLAHQPKTALATAGLGYDLQLSGHTHGGQFMPWTLAVKGVQPFVRGLYRVGKMWLYVSQGTGYWGPPMRLGAKSEITLVRLVAGAG